MVFKRTINDDSKVTNLCIYICLVQTNFSYSHGQLKSIAEKQIHIAVPLMKCVQHWFSYKLRNQLKKFAQINYPSSIVVKDHPSIVLELNHIKFDLVFFKIDFVHPAHCL